MLGLILIGNFLYSSVGLLAFFACDGRDEEALKFLWERSARVLSSRGVCTPQDLVEKFGKIKYSIPKQLSLVRCLAIPIKGGLAYSRRNSRPHVQAARTSAE